MARKNGNAPAQEQPQSVNLAAAVASEEVAKAQRVYVDVLDRMPTADGTLATVQREQRADGTLGEYMLAEVRKSKSKDQPDSVQRYSIGRVQALKNTLEAQGHILFS